MAFPAPPPADRNLIVEEETLEDDGEVEDPLARIDCGELCDGYPYCACGGVRDLTR